MSERRRRELAVPHLRKLRLRITSADRGLLELLPHLLPERDSFRAAAAAVAVAGVVSSAAPAKSSHRRSESSGSSPLVLGALSRPGMTYLPLRLPLSRPLLMLGMSIDLMSTDPRSTTTWSGISPALPVSTISREEPPGLEIAEKL